MVQHPNGQIFPKCLSTAVWTTSPPMTTAFMICTTSKEYSCAAVATRVGLVSCLAAYTSSNQHKAYAKYAYKEITNITAQAK